METGRSSSSSSSSSCWPWRRAGRPQLARSPWRAWRQSAGVPGLGRTGTESPPAPPLLLQSREQTGRKLELGLELGLELEELEACILLLDYLEDYIQVLEELEDYIQVLEVLEGYIQVLEGLEVRILILDYTEVLGVGLLWPPLHRELL